MQNKPKKYLVTFADSRHKVRFKGLENEVKALGFYDGFFKYTEYELDNDFINRFKDKLLYSSRGFGYWVWKPQVILQALEKINYGDILNYIDVGVILNPNGIKRLKEYFEIAEEKDMLVFELKSLYNSQDEINVLNVNRVKNLVKGDLLDYFNIRNNEKIINSGVISATVLIIKKTEKNIDFISKWLEVFKYNFNLVDDSTSISSNLEGFKSNSHDQAVFTILCYLNNIYTVSAFEVWYPKLGSTEEADWTKIQDMPFLAKRHKYVGFYYKIHKKIYRILNLFGFSFLFKFKYKL